MTSKCECGAELPYKTTPFMTAEQRGCPKCGRIHYVDDAPIDWGKVVGKPIAGQIEMEVER